MRSQTEQKRGSPWPLVWSIVGFAGVIWAGTQGSHQMIAKSEPDSSTTQIAAQPAGNPPAVTARSCVACHHFEPVLTHPTNVMASMPVPPGLPLMGGLVTCLTCHDASAEHATTRQQVGLRTGADAQGLCMQCHQGASNTTKSIHALRTGIAHLNTKHPYDSHAASGVLDGESASCMACHDGTTASDAGSHAVRTSEGEPIPDHPIGIPMRETARNRDRDFRLSHRNDKRIRLFDGAIGCGSCHSVYSRDPGQLVINNRGSKLCLSCHAQ